MAFYRSVIKYFSEFFLHYKVINLAGQFNEITTADRTGLHRLPTLLIKLNKKGSGSLNFSLTLSTLNLLLIALFFLFILNI
jgi:hypothetical protein